jgi:hypothetical protein
MVNMKLATYKHVCEIAFQYWFPQDEVPEDEPSLVGLDYIN